MKKPDWHDLVLEKAKFINQALNDSLKKNKKFSNSFDQTLMGTCAIGSYHLAKILKDLEINTDLVVGEYRDVKNATEHCWVNIDGYIIDPTYTQFGYKEDIRIISDRQKDIIHYKPVHYNEEGIAYLTMWDEQNPKNWKLKKSIFVPNRKYT